MVYVALILAVSLSALCRVYYKLAMRSSDEVAVVMSSQTVSAIVCFPFLIAFFPTHPFDYHLLALEAFLWGLFVYFEVRALRHIDLGLSAILGSIEYPLQLTIGLLVFHESLHNFKLLGAALIIFGMAISAQWKKPHVQTGMFYQVLAVLTLISVLPIDAILVKQISPWFVAAVAYFGPVTVLNIWRKNERREAWKLIRTAREIKIAGVTNAVSYMLILYTFTQWNYTDAITGGQLMICFSLLFGWYFLKEREHLMRRILACVLVIFGVGLFRA